MIILNVRYFAVNSCRTTETGCSKCTHPGTRRPYARACHLHTRVRTDGARAVPSLVRQPPVRRACVLLPRRASSVVVRRDRWCGVGSGGCNGGARTARAVDGNRRRHHLRRYPFVARREHTVVVPLSWQLRRRERVLGPFSSRFSASVLSATPPVHRPYQRPTTRYAHRVIPYLARPVPKPPANAAAVAAGLPHQTRTYLYTHAPVRTK